MKNFFILIALCASTLTSFAYDKATEGQEIYGSHCCAYGLSDGTVAIYKYYLYDGCDPTSITFPATVQVWDGETMTAEYEVSQVGYSTWKNVWIDNAGSNYIANVKKVTVSEGIKVINTQAFGWGATSLEEVTLPSTLTTIYAGAFASCDKLTKITCNAAMAPTLDASDGWDQHFKGESSWDCIIKNCKVIVPEGAAASYNTEAWSYWQEFYRNNNIREAASVTIGASGYTTYYNDYGYVMPEGVEGYMITGVDNPSTGSGTKGNALGTVATLTKVYSENDTVCDKMALLLRSTKTLYKDKTYNFGVFASGGNTAQWPQYDETTAYTNLLSGTQTAQTITSWGEGYYYYALEDQRKSVGNSGTQGLAFYWGAADGGVFTNRAHEAFLGVDKSKVGDDASCVLFITKTGTATVDGIDYSLYSNGEAVVASTIADSYLRGGDISELNNVEHFGAKFYNADGIEMDPLLIMKRNGCNIVRLRLYNNPGTAVTTSDGTYRVPEGYQDSTDVLNLAKRAKRMGMKIVLSFHYSDFWSDALRQIKPADWQSYDLAQLKKAVYDYTYNFLQKMNAQGTAPDYVALGNEIRSGILFGLSTAKDAVNGSTESGNLAALLNQGSAAVRKACPDAKIILHFPYDKNFKEASYTSFLSKYSVDYDVVGASYYPYYTNAKPADVLPSLANAMYTSFGKPLMVMETGYSWTQYRPEGRAGANQEGQLHTNGSAYNEASEAGQKTFMEDLQTVIKGNSNILGYLYWDPVMVDQQVNGSWIKTCWAEKLNGATWYENGNQVSNTTWFDYTGKALPVLEAVKEDAPAIPATITVDGTTYSVAWTAPVTDGNASGTGTAGDVTGDGAVTIDDVKAIVGVITGDDTYQATADVNGDGEVNILDVSADIAIICGNRKQ